MLILQQQKRLKEIKACWNFAKSCLHTFRLSFRKTECCVRGFFIVIKTGVLVTHSGLFVKTCHKHE